MHKGNAHHGGYKNRQPVDGTPYDPDALWAELPSRIAAAFPTSGRRGAPSRPRRLTVWRGVIEREARRAGCPTTHAYVCDDGRVLLPADKKARRHREAAVQALERAEGLQAPSIPHDGDAFKNAAAALRRVGRRWEACEHALRDWPAHYSERMQALREFDLAYADLQLAITTATGREPAARGIDQARLERDAQRAERDAELAGLVAAQERDERSDRSRRTAVPGASVGEAVPLEALRAAARA